MIKLKYLLCCLNPNAILYRSDVHVAKVACKIMNCQMVIRCIYNGPSFLLYNPSDQNVFHESKKRV